MKYSTVAEAKDGVVHGKVEGVLYMSKNFTYAAERKIEDGKDAENDTLDLSEIKVWMDMSSKYLLLSYGTFIDNALFSSSAASLIITKLALTPLESYMD